MAALREESVNEWESLFDAIKASGMTQDQAKAYWDVRGEVLERQHKALAHMIDAAEKAEAVIRSIDCIEYSDAIKYLSDSVAEIRRAFK